MTDTKPLKERWSYWIPWTKTGRVVVQDVAIHARHAALLNHALGRLDAHVVLTVAGRSADNTSGRFSAIQTMNLEATHGTEVSIKAVGNDCEGALLCTERALRRVFHHEAATDWGPLSPSVFVA